ncbi:MAG: spondin domain-containing protein [Planctomycetales bacterium]|nr:spondin domain-containing protein [Planctomycetales bacterium]
MRKRVPQKRKLHPANTSIKSYRGLWRARPQFEPLERRQLLAAETLDITIENLADADGLSQTPYWVAVHDGSFDLASPGVAASAFGGLETLAEEGDASGVVSRFAAENNGNDTVITAPAGFAGAPIFEPGESVTTQLVVDDTLQNQFFSFASMVIPSNDAFIANVDPMSIRLFDSAGDFLGARSIVIYGSQIFDAGTEVNNPSGDAAFTTLGGTAIDEGGFVEQHNGLDDFVGAGLPTGGTLGKAFGLNTPIARITIARASSPSLPVDQSGPLTELHSMALSSRADWHEFNVIFSDPSGVDPTSIRAENIRITGPLLTQLDVLSVATDAGPGTIPHEVTATFRVAPSSGSFTAVDNGTYSVVLLGNEVIDSFGHSADLQLLGDFEVNVPVQLTVTFENLADPGGLINTPVWVGAHNGTFQVAQAGVSASTFGGLEDLAEEGDVSGVISRFNAENAGNGTVLFAPDGFPGAPVFEPGESATAMLDIADPRGNRFFSFASMIIPSNDAFIANLDPRGIELFDRFGNFTGARTFTIYGHDIWDAGTEVNLPSGGAAFSTEGGTATDEGGVIHRHDGLDDFIGTGLPTGENLVRAFKPMTPIGRFTISLADIPSAPIDLDGPLATIDATDLTSTDEATHEVRVTYSDASGVDVTSIDLSDLVIEGFGGNALQVVGVTTDAIQGQINRTVTATYTVATASGQPLSTFDNGLYFVTLVANEVGDSLGNLSDSAALGSFEILVPVQLEITIENLFPVGGLTETPFWVAVHEGNFAIAAAGGIAADYPGLESIAEEGDASGLVSRFASESGGTDSVVLAPDGFAGAPVFEPGEVASGTLDVFDTNANRYFSFASMIIPSNDAFIGNFNPRAYELFDEHGFFLGERTITVYGRDIWDAGTEQNAVGFGAPFSTLGGVGIDQNEPIRRHSGLDEFIGTPLATGSDLLSAFFAQTPVARITIGSVGSTAVPLDHHGPIASLSGSDVTVAGTPDHQIAITYSDPSGVDTTSINTDDIRVTGPLGAALIVTDAVIQSDAENAPQSVTVLYTVATPDGQFTARNNGSYNVSISPGQVLDTLGNDSGFVDTGDFIVDVGVRLKVEIQTLTPATGLSQTPFWVGFHNGGFEVARGGVSASQFGGLELIAEEGDPSQLVARFLAESTGVGSVITAPSGFPGAPVFESGESSFQVIEVDRANENRFFSFATMVIPSNDAFLANRNSRQYELFDSLGNFHGARQITLYGRDILDAGTEINDPDAGAAFTTAGGIATDENGLIHRHTGLDDFVGVGLPTGQTLGVAFSATDPIATITISLFDPVADICSGVLASCSTRSVSLQNSQLSADVNRDGSVSPLDALLVINFLGRFGNRSTIADEAQATGLALDVQGDELISSMDALTVINEIGRLNQTNANTEGELALRTDAAITAMFTAPSFFAPFNEADPELTPDFHQLF